MNKRSAPKRGQTFYSFVGSLPISPYSSVEALRDVNVILRDIKVLTQLWGKAYNPIIKTTKNN